MTWPFHDAGEEGNANSSNVSSDGQSCSIADFLEQKGFDLVVNLPMCSSGARRISTVLTQGYRTRRMAVDYAVPLVTDVKCAKLLVEVRVFPLTFPHVYISSLRKIASDEATREGRKYSTVDRDK